MSLRTLTVLAVQVATNGHCWLYVALVSLCFVLGIVTVLIISSGWLADNVGELGDAREHNIT